MGKGIKKSEFIFSVYYVMFIFSLFLDDVAFNVLDTSVIVKIIKAMVFFILIIKVIGENWKNSTIKCLSVLTTIGALILLLTGDLFWLIILLMGVVSIDIDEHLIYKLSLYTVGAFCITTILLYNVGITSDILTYRTDFSVEARHSLGFVHSNVLPLNIFYLLTYYVILNRGKCKKSILFAFIALALVVYFICQSRNALLFTVFVAGVTLFHMFSLLKVTRKVLDGLAKYIVLISIFFSIVPGYLRYIGLFENFWYRFDTVFTNRTLLASSAMRSYGIHLINKMSYYDYTRMNVNVGSNQWTGIVLDSAYLYVLIRYGIVVLILLCIILNSFYKLHKDSAFACIVFIAVVFVNTIDNDFFSYGCVPFMILGIRNIWDVKIKRKCII